MIKLTASDRRRTLKIELPEREGTVRVGGMDLPIAMLAGARYRNWTDGKQGVVACQLPGKAMEPKP